MTRSEAITRLVAQSERIRTLGVHHLYLFGSTVRDEARPVSDVDIFVDENSSGFGLLELAGLGEEVTEILGVRADVATRESLHPLLRAGIEAEAVQVF